MSLVAGSPGAGWGDLGWSPSPRARRARSPAEPLGETGDGPNARCDAIRTRRASKFIPALALEPRDGSQKTWGAASNPNRNLKSRATPERADRRAGDLPSIASRGVLKPRPMFL